MFKEYNAASRQLVLHTEARETPKQDKLSSPVIHFTPVVSVPSSHFRVRWTGDQDVWSISFQSCSNLFVVQRAPACRNLLSGRSCRVTLLLCVQLPKPCLVGKTTRQWLFVSLVH